MKFVFFIYPGQSVVSFTFNGPISWYIQLGFSHRSNHCDSRYLEIANQVSIAMITMVVSLVFLGCYCCTSQQVACSSGKTLFSLAMKLGFPYRQCPSGDIQAPWSGFVEYLEQNLVLRSS